MDGASAEVASSVPTPKLSTGAPSASSCAMRSSLRSPLNMILTSCRPAWSSSARTSRESVTKSPLSMRTPRSGRPSEFDAARAFERIVGVDQLDRPAAQELLQLAKGFQLRIERHDPGMRRRPHHRNPVAESGTARCWFPRSRRCKPRARPERRLPAYARGACRTRTTSRPCAALTTRAALVAMRV